MGLIKSIKRGITMLFNQEHSTTADKLGVTPLTTDRMSGLMKQWREYYQNGGRIIPDPENENQALPTLCLPAQIAGEISRLMLLEFEINDIEETERWSLIKKSLDDLILDLAPELEKALAIGGMFIKPYITPEATVAINLIPQDQVIVFDMNDDKVITGAAFVETIMRNNRIYTRLESHELNGQTLTIINRAFKSKESSNPYDQEIPLEAVPEWAALEPEIVMGNIPAPLYGYFKVATGNNIEPESPLGISCYARAMPLIPEADRQFNRMLWEFEATEAAVHISADAMKPKRKKDGTFTSSLPKGKERLYRTIESSALASSDTLAIYAPAIREGNYVNGLNQVLMTIEGLVGLTRGTISNDKMTDSYSNELELKLTRNRAENTIRAEQKNLEKAVIATIVAINTLLDSYGIAAGTLPDTADFVKFGDSIIIDDTSRLESMRQDVNDGMLPKWKYIQEKYNTTEEEAKSLAAEAGDADPVAGLFGKE